MALIEFDHVRKHYPGANGPAVADLNLQIEAGEFLTLLGPSGSGKTTTLMMLAGFESPTAGAIRLDGQAIESLPAHRRNMGVVFQSYSLFPHLSVAQNVAFPLTVRKVGADEIRRRVGEALSRVRLQAFAERRPNQLSGGQQQRVALARALVFEPRVVLMDEPLSALDKKLREDLQLEIRRLHRELGVTMVFVTHDQGEAMTLSDRVAVFNQGRIEQIDTPARLYDAPANPFVAGFIGDNNMLPVVHEGPVGADEGIDGVRVRAGSLMLAARARDARPGQPGGGGTLSIRPEHLRIDVQGPARDGCVSVPATLVDRIHQGDHWRVLARLDAAAAVTGDAALWFAKIAPGAMPPALVAGHPIHLSYRPAEAWVF